MLIGISSAFGQIDKNDISMKSLDSIGKLVISNRNDTETFILTTEEIKKLKKEANTHFTSTKIKKNRKRQTEYQFDDYTID